LRFSPEPRFGGVELNRANSQALTTERKRHHGGPVPQSAKPDATTFPLGAHVRLRRGQAKATGVVIGNSTDIDRIQVQWDDTGEVTHCPKANLELVLHA
jgi:hypothetical protein